MTSRTTFELHDPTGEMNPVCVEVIDGGEETEEVNVEWSGAFHLDTGAQMEGILSAIQDSIHAFRHIAKESGSEWNLKNEISDLLEEE